MKASQTRGAFHAVIGRQPRRWIKVLVVETRGREAQVQTTNNAVNAHVHTYVCSTHTHVYACTRMHMRTHAHTYAPWKQDAGHLSHLVSPPLTQCLALSRR